MLERHGQGRGQAQDGRDAAMLRRMATIPYLRLHRRLAFDPRLSPSLLPPSPPPTLPHPGATSAAHSLSLLPLAICLLHSHYLADDRRPIASCRPSPPPAPSTSPLLPHSPASSRGVCAPPARLASPEDTRPKDEVRPKTPLPESIARDPKPATPALPARVENPDTLSGREDGDERSAWAAADGEESSAMRWL